MCKHALCVHWAVVVVSVVVKQLRGHTQCRNGGLVGFTNHSPQLHIKQMSRHLLPSFDSLPQLFPSSAFTIVPPHSLCCTSLFFPLFLCLPSLFGFYWSPLVQTGLCCGYLWILYGVSSLDFTNVFFFPPQELMIKISYKFMEDVFFHLMWQDEGGKMFSF